MLKQYDLAKTKLPKPDFKATNQFPSGRDQNELVAGFVSFLMPTEILSIHKPASEIPSFWYTELTIFVNYSVTGDFGVSAQNSLMDSIISLI